MKNSDVAKLYHSVKQGLIGLGYAGNLLQEDYEFADILSPSYSVGSVPLAAFAQDPPSYRNACFGVVAANGTQGEPLIASCRSLGAPQILELHPSHVNRWKMTKQGAPLFLESVSESQIPVIFEKNRDDWAPIRILEAKSAGKGLGNQLDFFDLGLLPLLEKEASGKLDRLLQETINLAVQEVKKQSQFQDSLYPALFRLLFRLIAAKILADRGQPGGWSAEDPREVIGEVQTHYFKEPPTEPVLEHQGAQQVAWDHIRQGFHFQNLSVDSLAFVYENTLIAPETRRLYGIHSTPPAIAEYIIRHLPFEDLPLDKRRVFEPFAGHGVFLVAALRRLRELMPANMASEERHDYFVRMLSGIESDPFACEVARLSLMLADYPNPNGWRLHRADALDSEKFEKELQSSQVVLCNPPFEDFTIEERDKYKDLFSTRKPAVILDRVLQHPPEMLGFVLPRSFMTGRSYKRVRSTLGQSYASLEIVALPDKVFRHSDAESVLLLGTKKKEKLGRLSVSEVDKRDLERFYVSHEVTRRAEDQFELLASSLEESMWLPDLQEVWRSTENLKRLADLVEIHRGIQYRVRISGNESTLFSNTPREGFLLGVQRVKDTVEPFLITKNVYLNVEQKYLHGSPNLEMWGLPKLVVNARRRTRRAWTMTASIDYKGVICYQNFHGVWPRGTSISLESLAAILNGPVANAFVATMEGKRDIQRQTLLSVPIPELSIEQDEEIASLVKGFVKKRSERLSGAILDEEAKEECSAILSLIDACVLRAYNLAPRTERLLLDYFNGQSRPGPVDFDGYFPEWFTPRIPWYRYISEELDRASVTATLRRLPVVDDPVISEAIQLFSDEESI